MTDRLPIELGDEVTDPITGLKGTAVAITTWMYGCKRINVQPKGTNKDGEPFPCSSFDEPQLKVSKRAKIPKKVKAERMRTGGPRPTITK